MEDIVTALQSQPDEHQRAATLALSILEIFRKSGVIAIYLNSNEEFNKGVDHLRFAAAVLYDSPVEDVTVKKFCRLLRKIARYLDHIIYEVYSPLDDFSAREAEEKVFTTIDAICKF